MPDQDGLTWLEIDDFTPGIITNSALAYAPNGTFGNTGPVPGKQVGQAQSAVGCIALPNGGLSPLPGLGTPIAPTHAPPGGNAVTWINGLFIGGPLYEFVNVATPALDDIVYGQETNSDLGSGTWQFYLEEKQVLNGAVQASNTLESIGPTIFDSAGYVAMTGDTTRGGTNPSAVNNEFFALAYNYHSLSDSGAFLWYFPNPTNPFSHLPYNPNGFNGSPADVICHQNRVIVIQTWEQSWTPTLHTIAYEIFNYTDPPNTLNIGSENEIFVQEHPFGHGAWGSINASELFLVKHSGGGYFIEGDLNNPTVIRLPGVTSTYGLQCRAGDTVIGLAYASNNRGLWVWNGGSGSTKISNQLDDNFFVNPSIPSAVQHGPTVDVRGWGDWIVVTNDWIFDTNTGGWWQLAPSTTTQPHLYYGVSWDGNLLYASVPQPSSSVAIDFYDRLTPGTSYLWESYPIRLAQGRNDRQYMVRQVVVRAQGEGTVTIVLSGIGGSTSAATSSPSDSLTFTTTAQPSMQMLTVGLTAQDITVRIQAAGTGGHPAPTVYSVAVGFAEQQPVSAT